MFWLQVRCISLETWLHFFTHLLKRILPVGKPWHSCVVKNDSENSTSISLKPQSHRVFFSEINIASYLKICKAIYILQKKINPSYFHAFLWIFKEFSSYIESWQSRWPLLLSMKLLKVLNLKTSIVTDLKWLTRDWFSKH